MFFNQAAGIATHGVAIADIDKDGYFDIAVARTGAIERIFCRTSPGASKASTSEAWHRLLIPKKSRIFG